MEKINSAHSLLSSIGGINCALMVQGYWIDKTTMPKPTGKRASYGKSLMSHFDQKRKELKNSKKTK